VTEVIGLSEEEEKDGDPVLLISVRVVRDVNQRPIHTLQAATTVPESERTGTPTAGKTVNGTAVDVESAASVQSVGSVVESVVIAADAISMIDPDETYSTKDPDVAAAGMTAESVENRIVAVAEEVGEEAVVVTTVVHGEVLHHHAGKSLLQI
jgi:hypothetical protein